MAEQPSGDTIRQLLQGFNTMQMQLGLTPVQSGGAPMGVPLGAPPQAPQIAHPGAVSAMVMQQQQGMMAQTMQAAQMTRYVPPPSAPMGGGFNMSWGPSYQALQAGQANPYMAQMMGGMPGMPNPGLMTSPQMGMFRGGMFAPPPVAPPMYAAHVPPFFSPFAPQMPGAHFMSPAMQNLQIMQARQSQGVGMLGGLFGGGMELGGGILGAAMGGPIGAFAGGFLGRGLGGMMMDPTMSDIRRGRQLQNTTAPFMVTGPNLNMMTGQGMERHAAQQTSQMLRTMVRDADFARTGFNTQDVMRITQLSADQGLLATARDPEQIARQVKDISKAVKALVQITGDPDVRNVIASLGQMRTMGFETLAAQAGAVANRATFARMAGVSQGQMMQFESAGAMQAQQMGLAGATGIRAAQFGAGQANIAVSSGAVQGLQLARVGGQQGLAQANAQAQMAALAFDPYLMASVRQGPGGMEVNLQDYQKLHGMSLSQVMQQAGDRMSHLGARGMMEFERRRTEFADRMAQKMSPTSQIMNVYEQMRAIQRDVPDLDLANAARALAAKTGMDPSTAQALAQQFESRDFWKGMEQQLRVQQRSASDRERARREQFRTPGFLRSLGREGTRIGGEISDILGSPFEGMAERTQRVEEDRAAFERGERVDRFSQSQIIGSEAERRRVAQMMGRGSFRGVAGQLGEDPMGEGFGSRLMNRMGAGLGLSNLSDANRASLMASDALMGGMGVIALPGDASRAILRGVGGAAGFAERAQAMDVSKASATMDKLQRQGAAAGATQHDMSTTIRNAVQRLRSELPKAKLMGALSAGAAREDMFERSAVQALKDAGMSDEGARSFWNANKAELGATMAREISLTGSASDIETLENARTITGKAMSLGGRQREALDKQISQTFDETGFVSGRFLRGVSDSTLEQAKQVVKTTDPRLLAYAAAAAVVREGDRGERTTRHAQLEMERIERAFSGDRQTLETFRSGRMQQILGDRKMVQLLENVAATGAEGSGETLAGKFTRIQQGVVQSQGLASTTTFLRRLQDQSGISGLTELDPREALRRVDPSRLKGAAATLARRLQAGERVSEAEINNLVTSSGPTATTERFGGDRGSEVEALEGDIERVKAAASQSEDPTQKLFAQSVATFAEAAQALREAASQKTLNDNSPSVWQMMNPFWGGPKK